MDRNQRPELAVDCPYCLAKPGEWCRPMRRIEGTDGIQWQKRTSDLHRPRVAMFYTGRVNRVYRPGGNV